MASKSIRGNIQFGFWIGSVESANPEMVQQQYFYDYGYDGNPVRISLSTAEKMAGKVTLGRGRDHRIVTLNEPMVMDGAIYDFKLKDIIPTIRPEICVRGMHACTVPARCLSYNGSDSSRVFLVLVTGEIHYRGNEYDSPPKFCGVTRTHLLDLGEVRELYDRAEAVSMDESSKEEGCFSLECYKEAERQHPHLLESLYELVLSDGTDRDIKEAKSHLKYLLKV